MKLLLKRILSYLPTRLPVGITEFNQFADDIIELSGKFADEDSMKFAIASMVLHSDAKHGSLPKAKFVNQLRKVAANQVASQVFQDVKKRQDDAMKAAQSVEVTTPQAEVPSNGDEKA